MRVTSDLKSRNSFPESNESGFPAISGEKGSRASTVDRRSGQFCWAFDRRGNVYQDPATSLYFWIEGVEGEAQL